jgi:chlorite dismutase
LHQVYRVRWRALTDDPTRAAAATQDAVDAFTRACATDHSALYSVAGGKGDLMVVHFRPTFDDVNAVELAQARLPIQEFLELSYCYISVAEASGYDSARKRQEAMLRQQGLSPADDAWRDAMQVIEIQEAAFLKARLDPTIPPTRYACFYPMSKRRGEVKNWYKLTSRERGELMRGHAEVGRKWTDRVTQVITGSIGFDDYEWGVTLFADDPVLFKRLVYEMRFDPVSSDYAEFGPFMTGLRLRPEDLPGFFLAGRLPMASADAGEG